MTDEADFLAGEPHAGARLVHLSNSTGQLRCAVTNYGARLVSCVLTGAAGKTTDVALGYPRLTDYFRQPEDYMGAIVGRCANRIAGGEFRIGEKEYHTTRNEDTNTLHGGSTGLHRQFWNIITETPQSVTLELQSSDGAEGFPGNLDIKVSYTLSPDNALMISYHAVTDAPTPVNLSNHAYWNLSGEGSPAIEDHLLQLNASYYTPVNEQLIPTGELRPVADTSFDFLNAAAIGARISAADTQLKYGNGYDHNWVLTAGNAPAAILASPCSGIEMKLYTSAPGMQFYSGNGLNGLRTGKSGRAYLRRSAVVLEPQAFPDSVHHQNFPDVIMMPGQVYSRHDVYRFMQQEL